MIRATAAAAAATGDPGRWLALGWSTDPDPRRAGRDAAADAAHAPDAKLFVAFCSADYDPGQLLAGIASVTGDTPLVGCSTESVITPDGPVTTGVAVVGIGGSGFSVATAVGSACAGGQRQAGATAARCFTRVAARRHRALMVITDGYTGGQERILAGVYEVVGASLPLIGGSAAPGDTGTRTFQLHGSQVLTDAVIGVAIGSDAPLGIGLRHGWRRYGEPLVVTDSANGIVRTLNDQPALATYLARHAAPPQVSQDPAAFTRFARTRPLGVSRRTGEDVRDVSNGDHLREGWLRSNGEIPEGGLVWLMQADAASALDAADAAATAAVDALDGATPLGLLAFDCVSRGELLGPDGTRAEVQRLNRRGVPVAGMYTWGEIARMHGINAYHNLTLAVLALG